MFACLYIPDFPAEAILRVEPELRTRAVAVLSGRPPLERALALNEKARQMGAEIGATRAQLEAWSELVLRPRSEPQEASAHAALLDCAQSFSPEVEDTAPDTVLLNLAGLEPLLGPLAKIARDLARRVSDLGLQANVAVTSNPDAALLAARGFRGVTLIPEGREAERLGELSLDVLLESFSSDARQAAEWQETFDRWGIRKMRALASLPKIPLSERLGQHGLRLQKLARGAAQRDLRVLDPPPVFEEHVELEYPIVLLEPLAFLLSHVLEGVCARLASRALAVQELRLTLELEARVQGPTLQSLDSEDADLHACSSAANSSEPNEKQNARATLTRTLQLPVPMLDAKVFLKLLQLDLQGHPPGAPIVKIHLAAEPARPRPTQNGLFLPLFPEPEKLELTLARIAGVVGEGRVGSAELQDTHREDAFEMRHFAPVEIETAKPGRSRSRESGVRSQQLEIGERSAEVEDHAAAKMSAVIALRLFRPPLRAAITLRDGKPVSMICLERKDVSGEIVWTAGPWRSSGDWSEQEGWSREEWDIAVPSATGLTLYRLVQDRIGGQWFVEGMYD